MVNEEVEKFDREEWKLRLEEAKRIYANGIDGLSDVSDEELERAMANAKAMPKDTKKHREERSAAIETVRNRKYSKKSNLLQKQAAKLFLLIMRYLNSFLQKRTKILPH